MQKYKIHGPVDACIKDNTFFDEIDSYGDGLVDVGIWNYIDPSSGVVDSQLNDDGSPCASSGWRALVLSCGFGVGQPSALALG